MKLFFFVGFRDIKHKLENEYHFSTKIPTCSQLRVNENSEAAKIKAKNSRKKTKDYKANEFQEKKKNQPKQLTTEETNQTRLTTKVNFTLFFSILKKIFFINQINLLIFILSSSVVL